MVTPDHIDFTQCPAKILHLGLLGVHKILDAPWNDEPSGWVEVLKRAKAQGLHTNIEMVSIDPETNRRLALPCLEYLDSLIINDYEAGCLCEFNTVSNGKADPDACMQAAEQLLHSGAMDFVIVHFPGGAAAVNKSGEKHLLPSVDVEPDHIKSSVGAGDAFAAGVLYGVYTSRPLKHCVQLGHAIAAASLRSETTVGAIKPVDECLQMAATHLE